MKFATKPYDTIHLPSGMLLHCLGKLKIQILCRYSADKDIAYYCYIISLLGTASSLHISAVADLLQFDFIQLQQQCN